ncbi:alpha-amylase family glycosyl hydrolase [Pseudonocardia sp. TRM90224]|uniref:alpha-amylase family glycosyl hydrolase n=1 Tax=Pseudonocardia sp. TRM90224 TaxID=2812678 RepID=UPI001E379F3B|nr:alpha-amylase family glycosyl hydrolase [Pseudonocardia sp. TRM90224]
MPTPHAPTALYHLYPLGFLDADQGGSRRSCRRTLRELVEWLPHVESLGADGLLLGPVFASLSHGYDTVTHREIDSRLGDLSDLDALVAAASARGVGVVLDGAFAYAGRGFHRLTDPGEPRAPWFLRDDAGEHVPWRVDSLVTPDYASDGYRAYVAETLSYWLDRGIAGFRLDSAWSVPDDFWRQVLGHVRESHPSAWFLGQVFDDDLPPVVAATTVSSATEYALMHGTRAWLSGGPVDAMGATLRTHQHNTAGGAAPHTFLGNHDFARLADAVPAAALPLAFAILMTLPGIPGIYYGDEVGLTSAWAEGKDDALLRPPLALRDFELGDLEGSGHLLESVRQLTRFRRSNPWLRTAALTDIQVRDGVLAYTVRGAGDEAIRVSVDPKAEDWQVDRAARRSPFHEDGEHDSTDRVVQRARQRDVPADAAVPQLHVDP